MRVIINSQHIPLAGGWPTHTYGVKLLPYSTDRTTFSVAYALSTFDNDTRCDRGI